MKLVRDIGKLKKAAGTPVADADREELIRAELKCIASEHHLDPEFVDHLYTHIFIESRRIQ